jgi:hypothetical protein
MSLIFVTLISSTVAATTQPEAYKGENDVNVFGDVIFGLLVAAVAIFAIFAVLGYLVKPDGGSGSNQQPLADDDEP